MPIYHKQTYPDGTSIAIWKIEEEMQTLIAPIPQGNSLLQEAVRRFTSSSRQLEWLAIRRLYYSLQENDRNFLIDYYPSGRPFLKDSSENISISHTKGYAAIALHPATGIGIDIERINQRVMRIRDRFLSVEEKEMVPNDDREKELKALLLLWSAKETMFKLMDKSEVDFIDHLHVSFPPSGVTEKGILHASETKTEENKEYEIHYQYFDEFVLTWGSQK